MERVLVTGAGDSVGRAIAERFLQKGAKVHICDVRGDAVAATLAANPGMSGSATDVGIRAEVDALFDDVRANLGNLSVLVNVVGMAGPRAPIEDIDEDEWDKTIAVNLSGMFYTMKRAVPMLKANGGGSIVNFSTCSTRTGIPFRAPYIASKAGVEGLTKNSARELGPSGIRVNAILPGIINNDRFRFIVQRNVDATGRSFEDIENDYLKYVSLRCKVELGEFADMVDFITSDAGKKITGEIIAVSGNMEWEE
ncbi:MAG TPA: SDR family oxidoreductase [Sphingopyxis sp.]|uniref:SDR family oxidoreductase n=1 Tax=Sphingopyxis sp. TaxID=1908224 RepID=UPI002C2A3457|nr:SDR family oxidoreductase [Sphingopyxis sp.]HWW57794.1 SDR family oxidoreductase [Sphingopyxis sp.]